MYGSCLSTYKKEHVEAYHNLVNDIKIEAIDENQKSK